MEYTILNKDGAFKFACSTDAPDSLQIYNTSMLERVDTPAIVLEGDFQASANGAVITEGDIILCKPDSIYRDFKILELTVSDGIGSFYAESAIMELSNENALPKPKPSTAQPITYYINQVIGQTDITININEVAEEKRQLEYTGTTDKKITRLCDILNAFDAEADVIPVLKGHGVMEITSHIINIYKEKGGDVISDQLIDDVNITKVETSRSIKELRNCIELTGKDNLKITNVIYDDGNYFSPKGSSQLYSRKSIDKWTSIKDQDRGLLMEWSYDTADVNELIKRGINELKKYEDVKINFTAEGVIDGAIGNYITISTEKLGNPVYLTARIIQKERCLEDSSKDKSLIGDFIIQSSELDVAVQKVMEENEKNATVTGTVVPLITQHVNTVSNNTISCFLYKNNKVIDIQGEEFTYTWVLTFYDKDGEAINTIDKSGKDISLNANEWDEKAVRVNYKVSWGGSAEVSGDITLVKNGENGDDGLGVATVVITYGESTSGTTKPTTWSNDIPDIAEGNYLWTKTYMTYTDGTSTTGYSVAYKGKNGQDGEDGQDGTDGVGVKDTKVTYQVGTSGTAAPTGTWSANIPSVSANQFLWTRTVTIYTDNTTSTSYSVSKQGADGQDGSDGVGITSTEISYAIGTSGEEAPESGWRTVIPVVPSGHWLWSRTITNYSNNTSSASYSVSRQPVDGTSGIIMSATAPTDPEVGQLWQTATEEPIKRWDGEAWVVHYWSVENLNVEALSALSANLGVVTAGEVKSTDGLTTFNLDSSYILSKNQEETVKTEISRGIINIKGYGGEGTDSYPVLASIKSDQIAYSAGEDGLAAIGLQKDSQGRPDISVQGGGKHYLIGNKIADLESTFTMSENLKKLFLLMHPVGHIMMTTSPTNPQTIWGGKWQAWGSGRVPVGVDTNQQEFNTVQKTGGAKLTENFYLQGLYYGGLQGGTGNADYKGRVWVSPPELENNYSSAAPFDQSIMQPYITCYMWRRTA